MKHGHHQPYSVEDRDDETDSSNHQKNHTYNSEINTWGRKLYRKGEDRSHQDQKGTYSGLHSLQPKGQTRRCELLGANALALFFFSFTGGFAYCPPASSLLLNQGVEATGNLRRKLNRLLDISAELSLARRPPCSVERSPWPLRDDG